MRVLQPGTTPVQSSRIVRLRGACKLPLRKMRVCAHEKSEYGLLIPKNRIEPQISQLGEAERKAEAKAWIDAWRKRSAQAASAAPEGSNLGANVVVGAMYLLFAGYAFFLSPNFTPMRDQFTVEALVGISGDPSRDVNQVFRAVFNLMGVWPAVYAALIIPSGRSKNGVPAWPFCTASFLLGMYALMPYMVLWEPTEPAGKPPSKDKLPLLAKGFESPVLAGILLAVTLSQIYALSTCTLMDLVGYVQLFDESRLVHATTLDFLAFTALSGYWMSIDAKARGFKGESYVGLLGLLPLLGPLIYLLIRPRESQKRGA